MSLCLRGFGAFAAPVAYEEISLLVRMHEKEGYIVQQVTSRSLLHPLQPPQAEALRAEGASDSLLQTLRNPAVVLPEGEAAALEAQRERRRIALQESARAEEAGRIAARQAAETEEQTREAARVAEAQALARSSATSPSMVPVVPGPPADAADFSYPYYFGDNAGYGSTGFRRRPPANPAYVNHVQVQPNLTYGQKRSHSGSTQGPAFRPSGTSGSGDRSVTALSGNATFVPSR